MKRMNDSVESFVFFLNYAEVKVYQARTCEAFTLHVYVIVQQSAFVFVTNEELPFLRQAIFFIALLLVSI